MVRRGPSRLSCAEPMSLPRRLDGDRWERGPASYQCFGEFLDGPAFRGFRPLPSDGSPLTDSVGDAENPGAAHPYSQPKWAPTGPVTSKMVAEVQVYDTASGLIGDLAWVHYASVKSTYLSPTFTGSDAVWTGSITLPDGLGPSTKLRLRVSELDYTAGDVAPKKVDTTFRRPFVAHLPIS